MEINNKFNINDSVYYMDRNVICKGTIKSIFIHIDDTPCPWIKYDILKDGTYSNIPGYGEKELPEYRIFKTREELILNLLEKSND